MINKKIIFRADGNAEIGLGHLFRLFALIEMYKDSYQFLFLTSQKTVLNVIPKEYPLHIIPNSINNQNEPHWIAEKYPSSEYMIITDGYRFDASYQKKIKELGYFLMYIDDFTTEYMYADIVVNHSPHVKKSDFQSEDYTQFALGTDYAMLRPSFLEEAKKERIIKKIDTAFVCFGGSDIYDLTYKSTQALLKFDIFKEINVILGGAYINSEIEELKDVRLKLHRNLSEGEMVNLMKKCNFAIAPASTVLYELCCIKMPVLSGYYVDNQEKAARFFCHNKIISCLDMNLNNLDFIRGIEVCINQFSNEMILKQGKYFKGNQKLNFLKLL